MAATLRVWKKFEVTIDGVPIEGGSLTVPDSISVGGAKADLTKSLATATTWDVWESGAEEPITDFDYLWVEADGDVYLELTVDKAADVGTEEIAIQVASGKPFDLATDVGKSNYTTDFGAGSDDVIDKIRIRNESGATVNVRVVLVT
jgi:hypothetical protein